MRVYVLLNAGQVLCAALSKTLKKSGLLFHLTRDLRVPLWIRGLGPIALRISHLILRRLKKTALLFDIAVADGSLAVIIPLGGRSRKTLLGRDNPPGGIATGATIWQQAVDRIWGCPSRQRRALAPDPRMPRSPPDPGYTDKLSVEPGLPEALSDCRATRC